MIQGYHATFGTYESYLPNDPRGSKSEYVGGRSIYETAGKVTPLADKNYQQLSEGERETLGYAQSVLKRPPVVLNESQIAVVGAVIGSLARRWRLNVWALAIMPCHVHLVFGRSKRNSEQIVDTIKQAAATAMGDALVLPTC